MKLHSLQAAIMYGVHVEQKNRRLRQTAYKPAGSDDGPLTAAAATAETAVFFSGTGNRALANGDLAAPTPLANVAMDGCVFAAAAFPRAVIFLPTLAGDLVAPDPSSSEDRSSSGDPESGDRDLAADLERFRPLVAPALTSRSTPRSSCQRH